LVSKIKIFISRFAFLPILTICSCTHPTLIEKIRYAQYLPENSVQTISYSKEEFSGLKKLIILVTRNPVDQNLPKFEVGRYSAELISEDKKFYWYLSPLPNSDGPYIVIADRPKHNLVFEAPHPIKDRATGLQAVLLLKALEARAAIISGNDRCAASTKSICSGKTRICGDKLSSYPVSDPAHSVPNMFHSTHTLFSQLWPNALFVQLHGFSGKGTDTLFVLSDGTRGKRNNHPGIVAKVRDNIRKSLILSKVATSCQDYQDDKFKYRQVCGRTNLQGRQLNGSTDICHKNAFKSSGRFLHIEQQWSVRKPVRDFGYDALNSKYQKALIGSLLNVAPCIGNCINAYNR